MFEKKLMPPLNASLNFLLFSMQAKDIFFTRKFDKDAKNPVKSLIDQKNNDGVFWLFVFQFYLHSLSREQKFHGYRVSLLNLNNLAYLNCYKFFLFNYKFSNVLFTCFFVCMRHLTTLRGWLLDGVN